MLDKQDGVQEASTAAATAESRTDLLNGEAPPAYIEVEIDEEGATSCKDSVSTKTSCDDDDPWIVADIADKTIPWDELSSAGKVKRVVWNYFLRQLFLIGLMYLFFCSLDFLSSAFRLLAGKTAAQAFRSSEIVNNPVAGLMMGVFATVLLQSSSTTTSIIVSMVGSNLLTVKAAIPIIMGANIGTSVTNTIVSITQSGERNQFRRAFGGATIHDMFNWLSVLVFLPLEMASGYLLHLSNAIVDSLHLESTKDIKLLKYLTEPLTKRIIQIDKKAIIAIAKNETVPTLTKTVCKKEIVNNETIKTPCEYLFMNVAGVWQDWILGLILLIVALFVLCTCLILVVKILNSMFKGPMAVALKRFVNSDMPGRCGKFATGYVAIMMGALFTMLVQSSSIFTSTLTPLVGMGVITINRVYPLTLGSNIGTTITAILSSLAQESDTIERSIQISMCHLFFNISGIILWYPLPFMRKVPIFLAKKMGDTTAKYRWFAILYLIIMFFIVPGALFALSYAGDVAFYSVFGAFAFFAIVVTLINILQTKKPRFLPKILRSWDFLPLPLHSLKPLDNVISSCINSCACCRRCRSQSESDNEESQSVTMIKNTKL